MNIFDVVIVGEGLFSGASMVFYLWLTWPFIRLTIWPMRKAFTQAKKEARIQKHNGAKYDPIEELRKQF